jgi:hypothetical protein
MDECQSGPAQGQSGRCRSETQIRWITTSKARVIEQAENDGKNPLAVGSDA